MTLTHVPQPRGSKYCGQACVATVAGVTLQAAIDRVAKSRRAGTTEHDLRRAFAAFGFTLTPFRRVGNSAPTEIALYRWRERHRKYGYHWIVINVLSGQVHDPAFAEPLTLDEWRAFSQECNATVTSWASVWRTA